MVSIEWQQKCFKYDFNNTLTCHKSISSFLDVHKVNISLLYFFSIAYDILPWDPIHPIGNIFFKIAALF